MENYKREKKAYLWLLILLSLCALIPLAVLEVQSSVGGMTMVMPTAPSRSGGDILSGM